MEILSKAQRNALLDAVAESGLFADDFSYEPKPSGSLNVADVVVIMHAPSGSRFNINHHHGDFDSYSVQSRLGDDPWMPMDDRTTFQELLAEVRVWSNGVADWVSTPDLWKSMQAQGGIPGDLSPDSSNTPFTPAEQVAIAAQLREIKEAVKKTYELTADQSKHIDEKFEEAEKASRRMGRKTGVSSSEGRCFR